MSTFEEWFRVLAPAGLTLIFIVLLVAGYNKRVTENDEPLETDELE